MVRTVAFRSWSNVIGVSLQDLLPPSLRANGSRECAPDDRLHEAIHDAAKQVWIASSQVLLAMTCPLNWLLPIGTRFPQCAAPLRRRATSAIPDGTARRRPAASCVRSPSPRRLRWSR